MLLWYNLFFRYISIKLYRILNIDISPSRGLRNAEHIAENCVSLCILYVQTVGLVVEALVCNLYYLHCGLKSLSCNWTVFRGHKAKIFVNVWNMSKNAKFYSFQFFTNTTQKCG